VERREEESREGVAEEREEEHIEPVSQ